jgi:hypothetical protein
VAYFAVVGTQVDYFVEVYLTAAQYSISAGEPNLYLPNGTIIDLANNLALATGGSIVYGPYPYTVSLIDLGHLLGADADEVRASADVAATSNRPPPAGPQNVTASTDWDMIVMEPNIEISKDADPNAFCEGDEPEVTYTYYVYNSGNEDLTDVNVVDDTCLSVDFADPNGDDGDGLLNPDETWIYECTMTLTDTTLNTVDVDAVGYWTGTPVADSNFAEVVAVPPPVVTVSPADATICDANDQKFCADVTGGIGPFTYSWTLDGEPLPYDVNCITVSEAGVYCVTVIDTATSCDANDCGTLATVPTPGCSIDSGPRSLCEDQIGIPQTYCTLAVADGYLWEIIDGNATIDGNDFDPCVDVNATSLGTITLRLSLYNDVPGDDEHCWNSCQIQITVEECGGGYCTFTQGFYGNAGGTACGGKTTTELINEALGDPVVPVVVGVLGERSITFSSAADIILRLPCGGTPRALPEDLNVNAHNTVALKTAKLLKGKDDRINNTLVGQVVALTLNMRLSTIPCLDADGFDQPLGSYEFPDADYICVQQGEDGCIMRYAIPESLQGLSVAALLETANMALAGDEELVDGAYAGASFVNELFDECMTIVTCPDIDEICDNDCDDDFDGLTDLNDPDCAI